MGTHVYVNQVQLPAPSGVVFWDLLDPEHVPEYDSRMRSWRPRRMPPEVGTLVDFEARIFRVWSKGTSRFTAFDPPHRLELALVSPATPLASRLSWNLVDVDGGCSFTYGFRIDSPRWLGWLGRITVGAFTSHLDDELPALAARYG